MPGRPIKGHALKLAITVMLLVPSSFRAVAQKNGKPLEVPEKVMAARLMNYVAAKKPEGFLKPCSNALVILKVTIDDSGKVIEQEFSSGFDELRGPSLAATKQWTYQPYEQDGRTVFVRTQVSVFILGDGESFPMYLPDGTGGVKGGNLIPLPPGCGAGPRITRPREEPSESPNSDEALLAKTRISYDAPFTRTLVSFDCAVQFDWKRHFIDALGQVPPAAIPTLQQLQPVENHVFVDHSRAIVSETPKAADLTGVSHGADLESGLQAMVSSGLNAWLPFSTNVILPVKPTNFNFQKEGPGYKLTMNGINVSAALVLTPDLRITNVVSQLPQPLQFQTDFTDGPEGYLLKGVKTSSDIGPDAKWESAFDYAYQNVQGFQLPSVIAVTQQATRETWRYSLTDCKVVTGITLQVAPPKR